MILIVFMLTIAAIVIATFLAAVFGVKSIFRALGSAVKDVIDALANLVRSFRRA